MPDNGSINTHNHMDIYRVMSSGGISISSKGKNMSFDVSITEIFCPSHMPSMEFILKKGENHPLREKSLKGHMTFLGDSFRML